MFLEAALAAGPRAALAGAAVPLAVHGACAWLGSMKGLPASLHGTERFPGGRRSASAALPSELSAAGILPALSEACTLTQPSLQLLPLQADMCMLLPQL